MKINLDLDYTKHPNFRTAVANEDNSYDREGVNVDYYKGITVLITAFYISLENKVRNSKT